MYLIKLIGLSFLVWRNPKFILEFLGNIGILIEFLVKS